MKENYNYLFIDSKKLEEYNSYKIIKPRRHLEDSVMMWFEVYWDKNKLVSLYRKLAVGNFINVWDTNLFIIKNKFTEWVKSVINLKIRVRNIDLSLDNILSGDKRMKIIDNKIVVVNDFFTKHFILKKLKSICGGLEIYCTSYDVY